MESLIKDTLIKDTLKIDIKPQGGVNLYNGSLGASMCKFPYSILIVYYGILQ